MDMKQKHSMLDARPVQRERISAEKYLSLTPQERRKIVETRIMPPRLGSSDFGGLVVEYKTPVYKVG